MELYTPVLALLLLAGGFAVFSVIMSAVVGPKRYNRAKLDSYECGIEPTPQPVGGGRFPVRYYITFKALGLDPSMSDALLAFLLTTVFNALPIGPGPSSIAASAALFSSAGIDRTASAGLVLLATAIVAAAVYSVYGAWDLVGRSGQMREFLRGREAQTEGASAGSAAD